MNSLKTICFPIVMLIFNDFTHLKQSICAYTIALKKHLISPTARKKYYLRDTSLHFGGSRQTNPTNAQTQRHRETRRQATDRQRSKETEQQRDRLRPSSFDPRASSLEPRASSLEPPASSIEPRAQAWGPAAEA